jgi:DNA-binding LacI/PurR family transcriptional regulator
VEYLKSKNIPFLVLGIYPDPFVYQIDAKHAEGCAELTEILLNKGLHKMALFCGDQNYYVTKSRYEGFCKAHEIKKMNVSKELIFDNLNHYIAIEKAVDHALHQKADCIVCMDDSICLQVLKKLRRDGIKVPRDIKVASFFGSNLLEGFLPSITSVDFANDEVGIIAAKTILSILDGDESIPHKIELGYEISMKESTK